MNKPKNRGFSTLNKTKLYQILSGNDKCFALVRNYYDNKNIKDISKEIEKSSDNLAGGNKYSNVLTLLKIFISLTLMILFIVLLTKISRSLIVFTYLISFLISAFLMFYLFNAKDKFTLLSVPDLKKIKTIKTEDLITFFIIFSFTIFFISTLIEILNNYNYLNIITNAGETSNASTNASTSSPQDPVRWWPSGTPQSWGIIGAAIAAYRTIPGDPRRKTIAAFTAIGISAPIAVFSMAVENPYGFNRLMYSWTEYRRTGLWPSNIPSQPKDSTVDTNFEKASSTKLEDYKDQVTQNFWGNNTESLEDFINLSIDNLFKKFISLFNLESVNGYLDELYGFIWFSQVLLIIISISMLILFLFYIFINIFLLNKDYILKIG